LKNFLDKMTVGDKYLGIEINDEKTRTTAASSKLSQQCVLKIDGDDFFQWCGLLFNIKTLEVRVDYGRFAGSNASQTLTINRVKNEGYNFMKCMRFFVKPRCIPILFDSRINSESTIMINYHQMMTMAAIKSLHYIHQGLDITNLSNERFISDSIKYVIHYAYNLIHSRLRSSSNDVIKHEHPRYLNFLAFHDALWLGLHAFETVYKDSKHAQFLPRSHVLSTNRRKLQIQNDSDLSDIARRALQSIDLGRFDF